MELLKGVTPLKGRLVTLPTTPLHLLVAWSCHADHASHAPMRLIYNRHHYFGGVSQTQPVKFDHHPCTITAILLCYVLGYVIYKALVNLRCFLS